MVNLPSLSFLSNFFPASSSEKPARNEEANPTSDSRGHNISVKRGNSQASFCTERNSTTPDIDHLPPTTGMAESYSGSAPQASYSEMVRKKAPPRERNEMRSDRTAKQATQRRGPEDHDHSAPIAASRSSTQETRAHDRYGSRGPVGRDTRNRTHHTRDEYDGLRETIGKLSKENEQMRENLENFERERFGRQRQISSLLRDLATAQQRDRDFSIHCDRQSQELHVIKDELRRAEANHEITRSQLIQRAAELQSAQLFINQADSLSGAEVIAMANALNAEILQSAAFMADSLDYTQGRTPTTQEVSAARSTLGEDLVQALVSQRGQPGFDPTMVQLALQVCLVRCSKMIVESWTLRRDETILKSIYANIIGKDKQSAAGRWRSMIQSHATRSDTLAHSLRWITHCTAETLVLAGWSPPESSRFPDNLQDRLSVIINLALRLRTAIGENITSIDILPITVEQGSEFNPETMDDTYAEDKGPFRKSKAGERVAGSTELGLCSRIKVDEDFQGGMLLKPKVILCSVLKEENWISVNQINMSVTSNLILVFSQRRLKAWNYCLERAPPSRTAPMVLKIAGAAFSAFFPTKYVVHIVLAIVTVLVLRAFSQGRRTNRERDLNARKILVTGVFTPIGLTVLQSLAQRGAHIIALSPHPIDSPEVTIIISLLRTTFSNEEIYAEQCDLTSPSSIRSFCTRFLTGSDQRIDAIIFAHEYQHIGSAAFVSRTQTLEDITSKREAGSLATFLMTTLLLPALLVAPVERDIRIITVVNPFYAAAAGPSFTIPFPSRSSSPSTSLFLQEGIRSLRTSIFTRHLQRILDALPTAQIPKTDEGTSTIPVVSPKIQKSNIVAVCVSPGISRADTIALLLNADWTSRSGFSRLGVVLYLLLQPLLRVFTKSPAAAAQTLLHALFLPTPFKVLSNPVSKGTADKNKGSKGSPIDTSVTEMPEEVLKPGALYADCAVVKLKIPVPVDPLASEQKPTKEKRKGKEKDEEGLEEEVLEIPDDGEFGGEVMGRLVWEAYEDALKAWELANPPQEDTKAAAPDVDQDHKPDGNVNIST
ncbi:hypothetical protein D9615_008988 [Tricholomella constricta]|uniref:Ketoreductase (KR) domain-containing protein n=1 Tax=Tricholomella constricta TaxID=117010 RepID=A0A8H5LYX3_9AGAR|nr:hypothetical protein D9615_008988 [Tricholomella constricta]